MIRLRAASGLAKAALGSSLLVLVAVACDEDGKTVPARCVEGVDQPIFTIKTDVDAGAPPDYSAIPPHDSPCITNTGHAVSPVDTGGTTSGGSSAGTNSGGAPVGGTDSGEAGSGGAPVGGSDAGAGGS